MYSPAHSELLNQDVFTAFFSCHLIPWKWAGMLKASVNTSVIKEWHSVCVISRRKYKNECVYVCDCRFIQVCLWSCEKPSICIWSVYAFQCVYAWTRLLISDKGHREWQGGQPAGVCQCSTGWNLGYLTGILACTQDAAATKGKKIQGSRLWPFHKNYSSLLDYFFLLSETDTTLRSLFVFWYWQELVSYVMNLLLISPSKTSHKFMIFYSTNSSWQ